MPNCTGLKVEEFALNSDVEKAVSVENIWKKWFSKYSEDGMKVEI